MDAPPPQTWGLGLRARMKAPPPSFIVFFSARDYFALSDANVSAGQVSDGKAQSHISWNRVLAAPRPITRLPAWHRTPVESFPGKDGAASTRIIMKRVFHPDPRLAKKPTLRTVCAEVFVAKEIAKWTMVDQLELPDAKSRRLESFKPSDALYQSFGAPQSAAEIAQIYLTAKVNIVNGMLKVPQYVLRREILDLRSLKRTRGVAPMKRSIDKHMCIERDGLYGGYRIQSYDNLLPIIRKAWEIGDLSIDTVSASIAEISANFAKNGRRDPRCRISLQGIPLLPDIIDRPELKDKVSLVLNHGGFPVGTKSPSKKSPKPVTPLQSTPRRLGDTVVKLVPTISPHVEPSPLKSTASPSTPFVNTPSRVIFNETPSHPGISISPNPLVSSASLNGAPANTPGPTLTFQAPLYLDSSSSSFHESMDNLPPSKMDESKTFEQSPNPLVSSASRNKVPTITPGTTLTFQAPLHSDSSSSFHESMDSLSPSKMDESKTLEQSPNPPYGSSLKPETSVPAPMIVDSPAQEFVASEENLGHGLLASVPSTATPIKETTSFNPIWPAKFSQIDFGPTTPSFVSANWLINGATTRPKRIMRKASRRKSEPLIPNRHKEQAARRKSLSPKLIFRGDVVFDTHKASVGIVEEKSTPCQDVKKSENFVVACTPDQVGSSKPTLSLVTPAICWAKMMGRISSDAITPPRNCAVPSTGVHTVDMRQNLDIFGAPAMPTMPNSAAVDVLAGIAQDGCNGHANVTVTEEKGRLIVRFKLPTEFSHLFPITQGEDESRFTISPSGISLFPRVNFHGHELNTNGLDRSREKELSSFSNLEANEENMAVSTCPTLMNCFESSSSSLSHLDHGPTMNELDTTTPPVQPELEGISGLPELGTTPKAEALVSSKTPSPTMNPSFTPAENVSSNLPISQQESDVKHELDLTRHEHQSVNSQPFDDSPERDYMRAFIKRSSRKRLSTTEAGSPIAPLNRVPLGAKSSNTPSPQKLKRKAENDVPNHDLGVSEKPEPMLKKARHYNETEPCKPATGVPSKELTYDRKVTKELGNLNAVAFAAESAIDAEAHDGVSSGPVTRRSTRIRSQRPLTTITAKSSIPTAIKLGARSGVGSGALKSTTRTAQQDISHQTRMNTRKNKGNAEYPAQVLAKYQEERLQEELSDGSSEAESQGKPSTSGKNVGWKTPLEAHGEEKPKKARATTYKSRATGIAKPSRSTGTTHTQKQQRTAKVAATLGMSQNGTPAKPNRVTRSSARI